MISALAIQDTSQPNSASGYMYPFGINSKMATVRKPPQPAFEFMNQPCGADQNQTIDHFFPEFLVESGLENSPEPLAYAARLPASSGHSRSERIPISSVVTKLKRLAQRAEVRNRQERETKWLAANRSKFRGRWIALDGDILLAAGASAKEVFARVTGHKPTPLVMEIVDHESSFPGW